MMCLQSIRSKIWICVGVAFIGFLIATLSTLHANRKLSQNLTTLQKLDFPLALKGAEVLSLFKKQTKLYEDAFLLQEKDTVEAANEHTNAIQTLLDNMLALELQENSGKSKLRELIINYTSYAKLAEKNYGLAIAGGDLTALQESIQQTGLLQAELLENFENYYKSTVIHVESTLQMEKKTAHDNIFFHLGLFLAVLLLSVGIINYVANRLLIRPLRSVEDMIEALAAGKLSLTQPLSVNKNDEIGQLAKAMYDLSVNLSLMVTRVSTTSEELTQVSHNLLATSSRVDAAANSQATGVDKTSAAVSHIIGSVQAVGKGVEVLTASAAESSASILEMAATFDEVAQSAENLFHSVDEVNSAIYEMATTLKQVAVNAATLKNESDITTNSIAHMDSSIKLVEQNVRETVTITDSVRKDAEIGKGAVAATISGIDNIKHASDIVSAAIGVLSKKTASIGDILTVIHEITEQTGLLALNAAIIAAQAGDHGKGFSVVASEIRELADRTAGSTKEIEEVIRGVQTESLKVVEAMELADKSIVEGEKLSLRSGIALENITNGVQYAAQQMELISQATTEQGQESRVIRAAMENITDMILQIASSTTQQQKGSELILAAAEQMRSLTQKVKESTREQSFAGKVIAQSTENINDMINKIKEACDDQSAESLEIIGSVAEIKETTRVNLDTTKVLDEAVHKLSNQTSVLQKEMGNFTLMNEPRV